MEMASQSRPTLSSIVMAYLSVNHRIEPATIELTRRVFSYARGVFGDMNITDFGYAQAERFQSWAIESGRGPVSANIYVKTIRPIFRWAMRQDLIAKDPFRTLRLFRIPKKIVRIYEPYEYQAMLSSCPNKLWQARLLLAKTAGLRRSEVLNLTINDVDFDKGILYVQPKTETQHTWRWIPKDKDLRELPLVEQLSNLMVMLHNELPEGQPYLMMTRQRYKRIMQLKSQGQLSWRIRVCPDENFTKPFKRILKRAEIKTGTFHDLRRTCITEWLESGLQPHEVMRLAGHSDVETTMRYYVAIRRSLIDKARLASNDCLVNNRGHKPLIQKPMAPHENTIGATGLEPATS
ncbi:MAG: tyrosine-type recombinase/integrase [Planctomycetota bacterium]|jgi:integrase